MGGLHHLQESSTLRAKHRPRCVFFSSVNPILSDSIRLYSCLSISTQKCAPHHAHHSTIVFLVSHAHVHVTFSFFLHAALSLSWSLLLQTQCLPISSTRDPLLLPLLIRRALYCAGFVVHGASFTPSFHRRFEDARQPQKCGRRPGSGRVPCCHPWPPARFVLKVLRLEEKGRHYLPTATFLFSFFFSLFFFSRKCSHAVKNNSNEETVVWSPCGDFVPICTNRGKAETPSLFDNLRT